MLFLSAPGCGEEDDPPAWCTAQGTLDASCSGDHCLAAVVVDYQRLEPRGFRILPLAGEPLDFADAETAASQHVTEVLQADPPSAAGCMEAGAFFNCFLDYETNDRWLVTIHRDTGQVVFAGLEVWADAEARGYDFPLPEGFSSPETLGCVEGTAAPSDLKKVVTGEPYSQPAPSQPGEAWEVVLRLNLLQSFVQDRPYSAMVITYAPAIGELDIKSTDWMVWVARH